MHERRHVGPRAVRMTSSAGGVGVFVGGGGGGGGLLLSSVHSCCLRAGFLAENRAAGGEWRGVGWGRDLFIIDHSGMSRKDGHPVDTRWTDWTSRLVGGPAVVCSDFYNGLCAHGLLSNSRKFVLTVFSSLLCNGLFGPVWTIKKNHYCYFYHK